MTVAILFSSIHFCDAFQEHCHILLMVVSTGIELLSYDFGRVDLFQMHHVYLFHCIIFFFNFGILLQQKHCPVKVILIFRSYMPRSMGNKMQRPIHYRNLARGTNCTNGLENFFLLDSLENQFLWVDFTLLLKHCRLS